MEKRKKLKQMEIPFPLPSADDLAREERIRTVKKLQQILSNFEPPKPKTMAQHWITILQDREQNKKGRKSTK